MVVRCACCQVEVSATGWSLVQRSSADCGASLCVISEPPEEGRLKLARRRRIYFISHIHKIRHPAIFTSFGP
jgi:hypothetical protein